MTSDIRPDGGRRIAFASYVDRAYLEGFEVLLTSLLLHNPWFDHEYIVLFDELEPGDIERLCVRYPRLVFRHVDTTRYATYAKGDAANYLVEKAYYILDAFRLRGYDRVVTLDVDMVILGDIRALIDTDADFSAVPQHFESDGGRRINSGVMTFSEACMSDAFVARMDAIGVAGDYELDRHDQGVLSAVLDGGFVRLDKRFNLVKRAVRPGDEVPEDTRILHYTGRFKPWTGGERGYERIERHWHDAALHPVLLWRRLVADPATAPSLAGTFSAWAAPFAELDDDAIGDLRATAERHRRAGAFGLALAALRAAALATGDLPAGAWRELGVVAAACSRTDEARVALTRATADEVVAPAALAALADLEWVARRYDAAQDAALGAIRHHPTFARAHQLLERVERTRTLDREIPAGAGPRIGHVAFYVDPGGNFGDVMLPVAVRASLEDGLGPVRWASVHAHQVFDLDSARWANEHLDAIVIGGGGLFLPDTAPNGNSGWQWNVTDEALEALEIPIVVYTVGYNLFPGQRFHGDRFAESLRRLVSKAAFVGLRNHGSVDAVREIVGPELAGKVEFLPCVTTVYGGLTGRASTPAAMRATVLLNIAFDRKENRFGDTYDQFVRGIADLVGRLSDVADVRCLAHTKQDEQIVDDVRREHGISIPVDAVYDLSYDDALDLIGRADVVAGMRGHAGMIPFGIGVPIVSIISHAKLRFFLEDIGHLEWGVDAADPALGASLESAIRGVLADREGTARQLAEAQASLRTIVDDANRRVAEVIGGR
ncbi:polysaccharide pyruvyl transferase family protein [Demequina iriomotensis]|uniref:polysaccharide pyruvyl transferase family protein n=1 Tax=Demequina iriomotensis TaxID=1536641 RepID=UPI00078170A7|nr:polysaccharide pyruvyl transferase family protein [Demequina iriomotensis]